MRYKLGVLAAKVEATYGTDVVPTATDNVILVQNIDVQPITMETDDYNPVMPDFGPSERIVGAFWATLSFDVLLSGGGAPLGTPPNHGVLSRGCGVAQTASAGTSVTHTLISSGQESLTIYYWADGVLFKLKGARGERRERWQARKAPVASFTFTGLHVPMEDQAMPAPTLPVVPRPTAVNRSNTVVQIDSYAIKLTSFEIGLGNDVQYFNRTGRENVEIVDRMPAGRAVFELPLEAEKNFLGATGFCTTGAAANMSIVHGTVLGNRLTRTVPSMQLLKPKFTNEQGVMMLDCELFIARPSTGGSLFTDVWT
jgi:hypothetical protein